MNIQISTDKKTVIVDGVEYELTQKGKKISEWLNELPDGYRELALANFKGQRRADALCIDLLNAISFAFNWEDSKEGAEFWYSVKDYYREKNKNIPPLPKIKFEVWKPKAGELIHTIDLDCDMFTGTYNGGNIPLYRVFKTRNEALEYHEKAMFNYEVEMFIKEKNEGVVFDYTDKNQAKFSLFVDCGKLRVREGYPLSKFVSDEKVFKSKEVGEEIIAKFDNEKLIKWWI